MSTALRPSLEGIYMQSDDRWLLVSEVARVLEYGEVTVRKLIADGRLESYTLSGIKIVRVYIWSLRQYLRESGDPPRQLRLLEEAVRGRWG